MTDRTSCLIFANKVFIESPVRCCVLHLARMKPALPAFAGEAINAFASAHTRLMHSVAVLDYQRAPTPIEPLMIPWSKSLRKSRS